MRGLCVALFVLSLPACGGKSVAEPNRGVPDASAGGDGSDGLVVASCSPGGVRLCGGDCGDPAPCPGAGCTPLVNGGGQASPLGVCWSDLADKGSTPCAFCEDGQGCVQRSPGEFVCVPLAVCGALDALGAGDVCWYGDKVPYDGTSIPSGTGCPQPAKIVDVVCGGDCPLCAQTTLDRCVGRGRDHPFGFCPGMAYFTSREDLSNVPLCVVSSGSDALPCPSWLSYPYSCAVFPYPPAEQGVAEHTGLCISAEMCAALAGSLPGGLWCFDQAGNRVAP